MVGTLLSTSSNDRKVPLVSLQVLLGHAYLTTTQRYLKPHLDQVLQHAREHHLRQADVGGGREEPALRLGYDHGDLRELFGWQEASP